MPSIQQFSPWSGLWSPADFKLLTKLAFDYLAAMLNCIEEGASWPDQLLHQKACLLLKDPDNPLQPLNYRFLLIMPTIYRKWAMTRLRALEGWIDSWKLNELFAGFGWVSAEDAWYFFALEAEH